MNSLGAIGCGVDAVGLSTALGAVSGRGTEVVEGGSGRGTGTVP